MNLEKFIRDHKEAFDDQKMPEHAILDFEEKLQNELHKSNRFKQVKEVRYISIAASFLILVTLGYLSYKHTKEQNYISDNLAITLRKNQSSSMQLDAIYMVQDEYKNRKEDTKILNAFFKILKEDSNNNSKIAVIDALLEFPRNQLVRSNLIEALASEKEPLVQLKLIKSIAVLREQRAKGALQKIINNEESLPLIKGNASVLLAMLNQ